MSYKKLHKTFSALVTVSQLGLSIAAPIIICIMAGEWLQNKLALGQWVTLLSILIGTGSGFCSMIKFMKTIQKRIDEEKEEKDDVSSRS